MRSSLHVSIPRALALVWVAASLLLVGCATTTPPAAPVLPSVPGPADSGVRLADGTTLANLAVPKAKIVAYHESGAWERQIDEIASEARVQLDAQLENARRPAIVLDVDDTALSTFAVQKEMGFGWLPAVWKEWVETAGAPAHPGVLALYEHAVERGVAVFFITGRRESLRDATERQLRAAGYQRWVHLDLKPDDDDEASTTPYKSARRRAIEAQGFEILINVGDQWSDLEGGAARAWFKIPNPMYYRP